MVSTPLIRAERFAPGRELHLKMEFRSPTGSWHDRVAAIAAGNFAAGAHAAFWGTISEALAAASACAARGVVLHATIAEEDMAPDERASMLLWGCAVEFVPRAQLSARMQTVPFPLLDLTGAAPEASRAIASEIVAVLGTPPQTLALAAPSVIGMAVIQALGCASVFPVAESWEAALELARTEGLLAHPLAAAAAVVARSQPGLTVAVLHETGERRLGARGPL